MFFNPYLSLELGTKKVVVSFSLNQTTQQVFGLMHGGIYPYIAESIASLGGWLGIDLDKQICVGIEVNANHVKGVSKLGETITGTAIALHPGKTIQVWQVEFRDSTGDLVSVSRCTLMIREKKA